MRVILSAAARRDRREAESYYKSISNRLRAAFRDDLGDSLRFITEYPEGAPVYGAVQGGEVRAKTLAIYPYTVFYIIAGRRIFVVAVANQSHDPARYRDRFQARRGEHAIRNP